MTKLKVFSGCTEYGSEVQAFKDRGHDVTTLGLEGDVDIKIDIRDYHTTEHYDFMTFHPPCTCFSLASVGCHWKNRKPDKETLKSIEIVKACIRIINEVNPTYFMIENSMAMLRTLDFMKDFAKRNSFATITYCQYGDTAMKPTDIWYRLPNSFYPKRCKNGMSCHTSAPRGSKTAGSTQGKKDAKERGLVPYGLSMVLCKAIENVPE